MNFIFIITAQILTDHVRNWVGQDLFCLNPIASFSFTYWLKLKIEITDFMSQSKFHDFIFLSNIENGESISRLLQYANEILGIDLDMCVSYILFLRATQ